MIVRDLDIVGVALGPSEADTSLIVDPNAHLPCAICFQSFESITGWVAQVLSRGCGIELAEFAKRPILNAARGQSGLNGDIRWNHLSATKPGDAYCPDDGDLTWIEIRFLSFYR